MVRKATIFIWVLILVLTGTTLRARGVEEQTSADWVVYAQILTCGVALLLGAVQLRRTGIRGTGSRLLILHLGAVLASAIFSDHTTQVVGYWILLAGLAVSTIALVQTADGTKDLIRLEAIWLGVVLAMVVKDALAGVLGFGRGGDFMAGGRLGMGTTNASRLSWDAALVFWVSFGRGYRHLKWLMWVPQSALVAIVFLSRTRMSMLVMMLGGMVKTWFSGPLRGQNSAAKRGLATCGLLAAVTLAGVAQSVRAPGMEALWQVFNRGQDVAQLTSLTGRTEVWAVVIRRILDEPANLIFGHGYGVSRFVINDAVDGPAWFAFDSHNAYLEFPLSVGIVGSTTFLLFVAYGALWLIRAPRLRPIYTPAFTTRALSVLAMALMFSLTQANLARKIEPSFALFIFYILILDRRWTLRSRSGARPEPRAREGVDFGRRGDRGERAMLVG